MTDRGEFHVVFGTGPLGLAVMRELKRRGHRVRMASRSGKADMLPDVELVAVDAADANAARRTATDAAVVYHCAVPPYAEWPKQVPPLMAGIIEAAVYAGARLVYGDNLYAYGPGSDHRGASISRRRTQRPRQSPGRHGAHGRAPNWEGQGGNWPRL